MSILRFTMQRVARLVAFLGLMSWSIGTVLSALAVAPDIFQRFGALGVAAAVLFFSDRLLKIELDRQKSVERILHEYGVELAAMRSGLPATQIPKEGFAVDTLTEERNFDALRDKADIFNLANTALITVATLQWGFGDLFLIRVTSGGAPA